MTDNTWRAKSILDQRKSTQLGEGVGRNIAVALDWYERAASGGDTDAPYILGDLHEFGIDIESDQIEALKWYIIAEKKTTARFRKQQLSVKLTADQVSEAEVRAKEWRKAHPQ